MVSAHSCLRVLVFLRCYTTMYSVIEFQFDKSVAVVQSNWMTAKKREVSWPPVKDQKTLDKYLITKDCDTKLWKMYAVARVLFETDNLDKAKQKLHLAEETSDLQTDEESLMRKRNVIAPRRFVTSSSEEDEEEVTLRPPRLKKNISDIFEKGHLCDNEKSDKSDSTEKTISSVSDSIDRDIDKTLLCNATMQDIQNITVFQESILKLLAEIKIQNAQILACVQEKNKNNILPLENFGFVFPMKDIEDIDKVEEILRDRNNIESLIAYLSTFGGKDTTGKVNTILKYLLSDVVASTLNFFGKRSQKRAFIDLQLRLVIVESVKRTSPSTTTKDVEDNIKTWLKHAPEREKKHLKKVVCMTNEIPHTI